MAILALVDHVLLQVVGESLDASLTADEQCTEDEGVAMTCVKSSVKTGRKRNLENLIYIYIVEKPIFSFMHMIIGIGPGPGLVCLDSL